MNINLVAPINSLGYGVVGFNVLKHLSIAGHNVALFPIGDAHFDGSVESKKLIESAINNSHFYDRSAPSIRIWHQHQLDLFPCGNGLKVGWPIFELREFTDREKHQISSLDAVFVCSSWAKEVVELQTGHKNVHVVPLGVGDPFVFSEAARKRRPAYTRQSTVFLNAGKWEKRKGHEELLEAFNLAFSTDDNVELWMINENPFIGSENDVWKNKYLSSKMGRNIKFFPRFEKQNIMAEIFSHIDCGVFPSHAEGWNLEALEVMACGGHVIATNYAGHTEFCNKDNARLINPTGFELANDGRWFHNNGSWCTFNIEDLASEMKKVHEEKQTGKLLPNLTGVESARALSWQNTADKIVANI